MFGLWKRKRPVVIKYDHWTMEQIEYSPEEFYKSIEDEFAARSIPGLMVERIIHKEGGVLSAKRTYLRIRRERLVFDVCFASFGTFWFISRRYAVIPFILRVWELFVTLLVLAMVGGFYVSLFGFTLGLSLLGASLLGLVLLMRNLVAEGLHDVDLALIQLPVIGSIYECYFRADSYYRQDTRSAYVSIVDVILRAKIDELFSEKGANLVAYEDQTPEVQPTFMEKIMMLVRSLKNNPRE